MWSDIIGFDKTMDALFDKVGHPVNGFYDSNKALIHSYFHLKTFSMKLARALHAPIEEVHPDLYEDLKKDIDDGDSYIYDDDEREFWLTDNEDYGDEQQKNAKFGQLTDEKKNSVHDKFQYIFAHFCKLAKILKICTICLVMQKSCIIELHKTNAKNKFSNYRKTNLISTKELIISLGIPQLFFLFIAATNLQNFDASANIQYF